eukprot:scaffold7_cov132-Cylindrotheca_fusiformis.AAC.3
MRWDPSCRKAILHHLDCRVQGCVRYLKMYRDILMEGKIDVDTNVKVMVYYNCSWLGSSVPLILMPATLSTLLNFLTHCTL